MSARGRKYRQPLRCVESMCVGDETCDEACYQSMCVQLRPLHQTHSDSRSGTATAEEQMRHTAADTASTESTERIAWRMMAPNASMLTLNAAMSLPTCLSHSLQRRSGNICTHTERASWRRVLSMQVQHNSHMRVTTPQRVAAQQCLQMWQHQQCLQL
jgi:hypothetical protein